MKYTKGKWKMRRLFENPILVKDDEGIREWFSNTLTIFGEDDRTICDVQFQTDTVNQGWGHNNTEELFEANASIICKAPEMYETLLMAMSTIIKNGNPELVEKYESLIREIES
jgi:hypothetical protein